MFNSQNYMELKAEPQLKKDLQAKRMYFWEKMVWQQQEREVERQQLYYRTTQYVINNLV